MDDFSSDLVVCLIGFIAVQATRAVYILQRSEKLLEDLKAQRERKPRNDHRTSRVIGFRDQGDQRS